jgi:hypothetical protein
MIGLEGQNMQNMQSIIFRTLSQLPFAETIQDGEPVED